MKKALVFMFWILWGSAASGSVLDLDSVLPGTPVPIAVSAGSLTATFSSPDGAVFTILPSFFSTISGNVLFDGDPSPHTLDIFFSDSLSKLTLRFALNAPFSGSLTLRAFEGGLQGREVKSETAIGTIPIGGLFPEGTATLESDRFDTVELRSVATDFGLGNLEATEAAAVPEPNSLFLMLAGTTAVAFEMCRQHQWSRLGLSPPAGVLPATQGSPVASFKRENLETS